MRCLPPSVRTIELHQDLFSRRVSRRRALQGAASSVAAGDHLRVCDQHRAHSSVGGNRVLRSRDRLLNTVSGAGLSLSCGFCQVGTERTVTNEQHPAFSAMRWTNSPHMTLRIASRNEREIPGGIGWIGVRSASRFARPEGRDRSAVLAPRVSVVAARVSQLLGPAGELHPLALRAASRVPLVPAGFAERRFVGGRQGADGTHGRCAHGALPRVGRGR